jgi:putative phosphotransacetylase
MNKKVLIEISARHVHLSLKDLDVLFGKGYKLRELKKLSQEDDFAAQEKIDIKFGKYILRGVRVIGPVRKETQIEISLTDAFSLKVKPVLRLSGNLKGTPDAILIKGRKKIRIKKGVIVAQRHLHCNPQEAKLLNIENKSFISIKSEGKRGVTFHNVKVRVKQGYSLSLHLDTDEGNSAGIIKKGKGIII